MIQFARDALPAVPAGMDSRFSFFQGLNLALGGAAESAPAYATSRLQRGLLLEDGDSLLAEEAVGFGVPVIKRGLQAVFPGAAVFTIHEGRSGTLIEACFKLNLVERFKRRKGGEIGNSSFYAFKDLFAAAIRRLRPARGVLTSVSSILRGLFGWETVYTEVPHAEEITMTYQLEPAEGRIVFDTDCGKLGNGITEVVLMHEQGARCFDHYQDSSGLQLAGDQIGPWDEVRAEQAWFVNGSSGILFKVEKVPGMRLFRGRELVGSRLAWAGFGYSFHPTLRDTRHTITVKKSA